VVLKLLHQRISGSDGYRDVQLRSLEGPSIAGFARPGMASGPAVAETEQLLVVRDFCDLKP
jgi:hypothetical protein